MWNIISQLAGSKFLGPDTPCLNFGRKSTFPGAGNRNISPLGSHSQTCRYKFCVKGQPNFPRELQSEIYSTIKSFRFRGRKGWYRADDFVMWNTISQLAGNRFLGPDAPRLNFGERSTFP
ncbi:hypothetical protein CEXT_419731 [Caerostris extrusa]|uniref:Uncharacterized protein n=1 Tax=Caerostris extrusa TaxID=172846 RepID=A0AAV4TD32_CAEEX|nr:hypothetical protein CEXT_419731 [Caerostris extrusa]